MAAILCIPVVAEETNRVRLQRQLSMPVISRNALLYFVFPVSRFFGRARETRRGLRDLFEEAYGGATRAAILGPQGAT